MTGITSVANYCDQLEQNPRKQKFSRKQKSKFTFIYSIMKYTYTIWKMYDDQGLELPT